MALEVAGATPVRHTMDYYEDKSHGMRWLDDLAGGGGGHEFYGVDNNCFKLGVLVFEAVEDPGDGYRSYLETVKIDVDEQEDFIFFNTPLARVRVVEAESHFNAEHDEFYDFDGLYLQDVEDGHIWLVVGTNNTNDYYPWFVFQYRPKEPKLPS